ncbi:MAG: Seed maturation protein [Rhodobacteraceae bacterium HLUCCA12]|nr:MAG: Seed maturation protein [Rhodobacteraceae bacterium HLUCCA12]
MPEFWVASGHHLTRLDRSGRMIVTDELLLAWLARPEVVPPTDACAVERAVYARLMADPRAQVEPGDLAAMADPDARENWGFLLALRDALVAASTIEGGYADIVHRRMRLPIVFMNQLVQLILRNALDGCGDAQVLRAAELLFRPQRAHVRDGTLLLADEELTQAFEAEMHSSPLTAMFSGGIDGLDVLGGGNEWTYWSRSDAHTTVLNFGGDPLARQGLARALQAFVTHMTGYAVTVTPHTRADGIDLRWFVGLDQAGTAIGNALWKGQSPRDTLVGLFELQFAGSSAVLPDVAGHPVWLILGLAPDMSIRVKPQNLLTGLPLAAPTAAG